MTLLWQSVTSLPFNLTKVRKIIRFAFLSNAPQLRTHKLEGFVKNVPSFFETLCLMIEGSKIIFCQKHAYIMITVHLLKSRQNAPWLRLCFGSASILCMKRRSQMPLSINPNYLQDPSLPFFLQSSYGKIDWSVIFMSEDKRSATIWRRPQHHLNQ